MSKKTILIIVGILTSLTLLTVSCAGVYFYYKAYVEKTPSVEEQVLSACLKNPEAYHVVVQGGFYPCDRDTADEAVVKEVVIKTVEVEKVVEKTVEVVVTATPTAEPAPIATAEAKTPVDGSIETDPAKYMRNDELTLRYDNAGEFDQTGCTLNSGLTPGQTRTVANIICQAKTPAEAWIAIQDQIGFANVHVETAPLGQEITVTIPVGTAAVLWNSTCPIWDEQDVPIVTANLVGPGCIRFVPEYGADNRTFTVEQTSWVW